jgi:hypothetical protein
VSINSAREFLLSEYGDALISSIDETDVTVGTNVVLIAARNGACLERIISNNGAAAIFVSSKVGIAVNKGIQLAAGGTLSFDTRNDFDLASCDLFAISAGSGNPVHVIAVNLVGAQ